VRKAADVARENPMVRRIACDHFLRHRLGASENAYSASRTALFPPAKNS